mmetsp:Transcript_24480/g.61569  ORF Transcript_24480/g.61569 Transcript_24480/m.61569 type:complete len:790 (+) Transcript_24480:75-2444(+)
MGSANSLIGCSIGAGLLWKKKISDDAGDADRKKAEEQDADGPSAADLQRNPNASPLNTEKLELHPLTLTEQQISETVRSAVQILMGEDGAQLRAIVLEEMQKPNAVLAYYEPGRPDKAAKIVLSDENNAVRVVGGGQGGEDPFSKRLLARFEAVPSGKYMPMVNSAVSFEENKKLVLDNLLNQQLKNMFLMPDVKSALESAVKGGLPMPRQRMVQSDDQTKLVNDPGANILAQEAAKLGQQQPQAGSAGGLAGGAAGGESPVREAVVNPDAVGAGGAASTSGAFLQEGGAAASEAAKTAPPASAQAPQESQQKFVSWSVKRDDTASAEHYAADALYVAGNMLMLSKVAGLDSDTPGALTLLDAAPGDVAETPQQLVEEKKDLDKSPSLSVVDFIGAWGDGGGAPFRSTPGGNGAAASASASSSSYNDRVEDFVSGARLLLIAEDQSQLHKSISAGAAGEMKDPENPADGDPQPNLAGDVIREVAQEWGTIFAQRLQNQREGKNAQPFLRLCEQTAVFSTSLSAENASWCKEALGAGGSNKKDAFAHLRRALTSAEGAKSRNAQPEAGARKQQAETDHAAEETQKALDAMEDARKKQKQVKALEEADNPGEDQPWTSTSSALVEASPGEAENRGRLKSEGRHKQESTREDGLQDDEAPRKTSQVKLLEDSVSQLIESKSKTSTKTITIGDLAPAPASKAVITLSDVKTTAIKRERRAQSPRRRWRTPRQLYHSPKLSVETAKSRSILRLPLFYSQFSFSPYSLLTFGLFFFLLVTICLTLRKKKIRCVHN